MPLNKHKIKKHFIEKMKFFSSLFNESKKIEVLDMSQNRESGQNIQGKYKGQKKSKPEYISIHQPDLPQDHFLRTSWSLIKTTLIVSAKLILNKKVSGLHIS